MDVAQTVKGWFESYAEELGSPLVWDDAANGCGLQIGDDLVVDVTASEEIGGIHFACAVGSLPEDKVEQAELLQRCMLFNLHQVEFLGGSLGLLSETGEMVLGYSRPVEDMTAESTAQALERFVEAAGAAKCTCDSEPASVDDSDVGGSEEEKSA